MRRIWAISVFFRKRHGANTIPPRKSGAARPGDWSLLYYGWHSSLSRARFWPALPDFPICRTETYK